MHSMRERERERERALLPFTTIIGNTMAAINVAAWRCLTSIARGSNQRQAIAVCTGLCIPKVCDLQKGVCAVQQRIFQLDIPACTHSRSDQLLG